MELGFHIPIFDIDGGPTAIAGELARVGSAAEESGASWLSFMDHYFQMEPTGLPAEANMLEGYTSLGFLAGHTTTIELGLLVTGVTYRHPGLLAKIVTTLDVLSGRPGGARHRRGVVRARAPGPRRPVPAAARAVRAPRGDAPDRQADVGPAARPYEGTHYQLAETLCVPAAAAPGGRG